jgi:hypothetical protein
MARPPPRSPPTAVAIEAERCASPSSRSLFALELCRERYRLCENVFRQVQINVA